MLKALTDDPLRRFAFTLRFFTRLPVPLKGDHEGDLAENTLWFPIAGLVVGLIIGLVWWVGVQLLPPMVAAGLAIGAGILITGGLHEDGFADCADGLGGSMTKDRALEIMRDSRVGAYGAIALVMTIGLRWAALTSFALWSGLLALVLAHMGSRALIALPLAFSQYARSKGLADSVSQGILKTDLAVVLAIPALVGFLLLGWMGLVAFVIAILSAWFFLQRLENRLGGYTGDGLGAIQQIGEITILIALAGFAS